MKQPIAIGVENYKTIIENNYYYIDKTWMLKELADQKGLGFSYGSRGWWASDGG